MKNTKAIDVYVVDNDQLFLIEFDSEFTNDRLDTLHTSSSVQKFLAELREQTNSKNNNFSIVIINDMIISHGLNTKSVVEILPMIKNIDKETSVIVLTDNDNLELKLSSSDLRPDAFIKKDKMLYLKLGPAINRIISRYELKKYKQYMRLTAIIAIIVITITIVHIIVASIIS